MNTEVITMEAIRFVCSLFLSLLSAIVAPPAVPEAVPNDNRQPAGTLVDGVLTLELRAQAADWRPEGPDGPVVRIEAFGEAAAAPSVPGPLIRVTEGTEIDLRLRNDLDAPLRAHGFCERGGAGCAPIDVPPGAEREVRFKTGPAGTYHYWATSTGMPLVFRATGDTQLSGAFIVDPVGAAPAADRVFVITDWTSLTREQLKEVAGAPDPGEVFLGMNPQFTFPINGLVWPYTERLTYRVGDKVRWRVINLSTQVHTMHLHGFYYEIDSLGDGDRGTTFSPPDRQRVVTQLVPAGGTLAMTWTPERPGNWLYHCHIRDHVSPERRLGAPKSTSHGAHSGHDAAAGMAGMILGVTVVDAENAANTALDDEATMPARKMTLEMRADPNRPPDQPAFGFVRTDEGPALGTGIPVPGPLLVLERDQPVEITLINKLPEGTAIHWHGMELDSYYDGVHGYSGVGQRVTPLIEPGGSFVVRFTPPRSGTFMYHTHMHDNRQLTAGLYGAMIVTGKGETYDPSADHVFVLGRRGPERTAPVLINGENAPRMAMKAGTRHRIRLINITPNDIFNVMLQTNEGPVTWRPLTKDGAPLPPSRCQPVPAKQAIGVGEIYDFEYEAPAGRRNVWLEVRSSGGKWQAQGLLMLR